MVHENNKHLKKYAAELEALHETINQIEKYDEEVKSEIAVTKRVTYVAEKSMQTLEKHKQTQDLYVDKLNAQIRKLQEQLSLNKGQIENQIKETVDANAVVQDTVRELELIVVEKKQLMVQWKSSLAGLSRRDEALSQAQQTLAAAESAVHDYDVEIEATRRNIQLEQQQHETLVSMRDKLENELQWVEENLTKMRQEREQLQERYSLLSKSLTQTDAEAKKLDIVGKQLSEDAESLLQNLQIVTLERQNMEVEMQLVHNTHANVNKAIDNLNNINGINKMTCSTITLNNVDLITTINNQISNNSTNIANINNNFIGSNSFKQLSFVDISGTIKNSNIYENGNVLVVSNLNSGGAINFYRITGAGSW